MGTLLTESQGNELYLRQNTLAKPEDLADVSWGDLTVKRDAYASLFGFMDHGFDTIGLETCKRNSNPARVHTKVCYDPEKNCLKIGLRNRLTTPVSGQLLFDIKGDLVLANDRLSFTLQAQEEKWLTAKVLSMGTEYKLEVYSDVPGVRPSRL